MTTAFRRRQLYSSLGRIWCACALSLMSAGAVAQQPVQIQPATHHQPAHPEQHQLQLLPLEQVPTPQARTLLCLADLEQLALHNNPSLGRAHAQVQIARGNWVQVGLPPNPSVGYSGQQLGSNGLAEQHGVYVTQEIIRGGKQAEGKDVWEGGKILDPENGKEYTLRLTPIEDGKKLEVRGSIAFFGRTQTWVRTQ